MRDWLDLIVWFLKLIPSLLLTLWDGLWEARHLAKAQWHLRQYERHPERAVPFDALLDELAGEDRTFHEGDEVSAWLMAKGVVTERGIKDGKPIYEVQLADAPKRMTLRGWEMEKVNEV